MTKSSISNDETSSNRIYLREGDAIALSIPVSGVVTGISSVTLSFYKDGGTTDLATTYWTTAACTVTGINTVVTGVTQNLKSGDWIISVNGTVDSLVQNIVTIPATIKRKGSV